MSDAKRKRVITLVGIEPVKAAAESKAADGPSRRTARRTMTNPYGIEAVTDRAAPSWSQLRDPALYGRFAADGSGLDPAHRTRVRGRVLSPDLFYPTRSLAPVPPTEIRTSNEPLPPVGTVLEKFRLDELLGVGGFAAVYRATHLLLKRQVAVKLLRPSVVRRKPELVRLLPREAELAARLDHPNVVRMIDVFHGDSGTFLVMEYVEGRPLASLLNRRPIRPSEIVDIGLDVVRGLRAGLEKGLIHRDIKPGNIIVTQHGTAKLVDFGLALCFSEVDTEARARVVGTRGYVAPEQVAEPHKVDFRADVFSLGATLYHAALGVAPFPADDSDVGLESQSRTALVPPQRILASFPSSLARLLTWMLAHDRADRPSSYELLEQALERVRLEVAQVPGARS